MRREIKSNGIKKHLEEVTPKDLIEFRRGAFIPMASVRRINESYEIGVSGLGLFVVKTKTEYFEFTEAERAVEKYGDLVAI